MSTPSELQAEEREVLLSIYDGDPAFNQLSSTVFQYKYGEDDNNKSFLVELQWGDNYPNDKPTINMNTFYNRNIVESVKDKVAEMLNAESDQLLGEAMTYSLFECVKEKHEQLLEEQPEVAQVNEPLEKMTIREESSMSKKLPKKEQLSKAQKRRQWDRVEARGEKPRGWDWVDIVKHLSQTGPKEEPSTTS